jgi:hypothetical protein
VNIAAKIGVIGIALWFGALSGAAARPTSDLTIHVVDEQGQPVAGAKVGLAYHYSELSDGVAGTTFQVGATLAKWGGPGDLPEITDADGAVRIPSD